MATKTYSGSCHCQAVTFDVALDLDQALQCNCSICSKLGALWTFVKPEQFALRSGEDCLTEYRFNRKVVEHLSCTVCGVESFVRGKMPDGSDVVGINVRCLDGVDLAALTVNPVDGRSL